MSRKTILLSLILITLSLGSFQPFGCNTTINGTVTDSDSDPISGAIVSITDDYETYVSSTTTDSNGNYTFEDAPYDNFTITVSSTGYENETKLIGLSYIENGIACQTTDGDVQLVGGTAVIRGTVTITGIFPAIPASGAIVTITPGDYITIADNQGEYLLENIPVGNYTVTATSNSVSGEAEVVISSSGASVTVNIYISGEVALKPNIYLYPENTREISVLLNFRGNDRITVSIPPYNDGWNVTVTPEGLIDNTYGYLFYEAILFCELSFEEGWVISNSEFSDFFTSKLEIYGFNQTEINDYIEYWSVNIPDSDYYLISPLITEEMQSLLPLEISPVPDSLLRVWFVIKSISEATTIDEPTIDTFERTGFVATEWGVILR